MNQRIQKFTTTGTYEALWGSSGAGYGQFQMPEGLAISPLTGNLYVADTNNHRIQEFTPNGTFLTAWGVFGTGHGQFNHPFAVALDAGGAIYVADADNNRIQKFAVITAAQPSTWGAIKALYRATVQ